MGNAVEDGALEDGRTGASKEEGRRDLGNELGMESKFTAASILKNGGIIGELLHKKSRQRKNSLRCLASQVVPDVFHRHVRELGRDVSNRAALDLSKCRTCEVARELKVGWCGHRSAVHWVRE